MLKLTFLGTSAGVPTKARNVTGLAVSLQNPFSKSKETTWVLVDCGEGTQHQLLHTPLSLLQLQAICITHVHGDHCYGLAGLLASMAMNGRKTPLTLIAPQAISKLLDTLTITTELYFNYPINFIAIETLKTPNGFQSIDLTLTHNHRVTIDIIALSHRTASYAFKFTQNIEYQQLLSEKLQALNIPPSHIWGKLQNGKDVMLDNGETLISTDFIEQKSIKTAIIVAGDNDQPELLTDFCQDIAVLVHEATYTQAIADKIKTRGDGFDPKHSSAKQVATFANNVKLPNLILTHFSGRFQLFDNPNSDTPNMGHIRTEVEQCYQGNCWLANDFDVFEIDNLSVKLCNSH